MSVSSSSSSFSCLLIQLLSKYSISHPSWTEFLPRSEAMLPPSVVTHFSETYRLSPPTLSPAAILSFLTLALRVLVSPRTNHAGGHSLQFPASFSSAMRRSEDWDTDWYRCINLGQSDRCRAFSKAYISGSVDGVWEGVFTVSIRISLCLINRSHFSFQYTEFNAYTKLLSGGAPPVLTNCLVAHHQQTWKLREYYLSEHQEAAREKSQPVGSGDPLRAYFPAGTRLQELSDSIEIHEPGRDAVHYWRTPPSMSDGHKVMDVIILGEVSCSSSWMRAY